MSNELDIYTHEATDLDGSIYRVINSDVVLYRGGINAIDTILSRFSDEVDKLAVAQIFIKGNRLFFTYEGVKYWFIPSVWAYEWQIIDKLLAALGKVVSDVAYKRGELD